MKCTIVRIAVAALLVSSGPAARAQSESRPPPEESESESLPQESQGTVLIGMVWWIGGKKGAW